MIKGYVDFVGELHAAGWAYDPDAPDAYVRVEIWCDGKLVTTATANEDRADLAGNGIGKGDHAFRIAFAETLSPSEQSRFIVRARLNDGVAVELPRWTVVADKSSGAPRALSPLGPACDVDQRPIFVLGSVRSGTSVVAQSLMLATRYRGNQEGLINQLIASLDGAVELYYDQNEIDIVDPRRDTMIKLVPRQYFTEGVAALFVSAMRQLFPDGLWVDKTPGFRMISQASRFAQLWPNARFIYMRRRPLENLVSRRRKYREQAHRESCELWARCMEAWSQMRPAMSGRALELDQLCVARAPDLAAAEIGALVGLDREEVDILAATLAAHHPEQTSGDVAAALDAVELGWTADQWRDFDEVCGEWMEHFNYSKDQDYFLSERPDNWFKRV